MGFTIQFESRLVELSACLLMEFDPSVLEFYDQAPPIKLRYVAANGRPVVVEHTPDFFLLKETGAEWNEWKTEGELISLTAELPARYVRDDKGWRCPPAEVVAAEVGLTYRLRSDAEINPVRVRNARFLQRYCGQTPAEEGPLETALRTIVVDNPGIVIRDLIHAARGPLASVGPLAEGAIANALYSQLVLGTLYVDMDRTLIDDQAHAPVFVDSATAVADPGPLVSSGPGAGVGPVIPSLGARFDWNGSLVEIINVGTKLSFLGEAASDGVGKIRELGASQFDDMIRSGSMTALGTHAEPRLEVVSQKLDTASPRDWNVAVERLDRIKPVLDGNAPAKTLTRNEKRWLHDYRMEDRRSRYGVVGLLPTPRPGNRTNHAVVVTDEALAPMLKELYKKPWRLSDTGIVARVRARLATDGIDPLPSVRRCRTLLQTVKDYEADLGRKGRRGSYSSKPFNWKLGAASPPHGTRPWERAHIDHTTLDEEVVDESDRTIVIGRPRLTVLLDAYSRRVLSFILSFDDPSYRSDMLVLRECFRRYNRLPETIITDGGPDFRSVYYERLLAAEVITKEMRPPGQSRFGSVMERFFGTTDSSFIHELRGQTTALKNVRAMSPEVDPRRLAVWDLTSLSAWTEKWCYETYDLRFHSGIGASPRSRYMLGIEMSGACASRPIADGTNLAALFLPSSRKGTLKISSRRGLRFKGGIYWDDVFRKPRLNGVSVEFVYDPFDVRYILAFIDHRWVRCEARDLGLSRPVSEKELKLAAAVYEGRRRQMGQQTRASQLELGRFLLDADAHGDLLEQRRKDDALRKISVTSGLMRSPDADVIGAAQPDSVESLGRTGGPSLRPIQRTKLEEYR